MAYVTTDYKLAAGNDNAGGLTAFTSITDGTNTLIEPHGLPFALRGRREVRTNGVISRAGFPRVVLRMDLLHTQWLHLIDTYEGLVTVRLAYNSTSWANYNAVLGLADSEEMTSISFAGGFDQYDFFGPGFLNAPLTFTRLEAL